MFAYCMLQNRTVSKDPRLSDGNRWRNTGDMITQTAVGCCLLPLAKQSPCYSRENELLNIFRLNRLIPKWLPQGVNRDHTTACVCHLYCLFLLLSPDSVFNVSHIIVCEIRAGCVESVILSFGLTVYCSSASLWSWPRLSTLWHCPCLLWSTSLCRNQRWTKENRKTSRYHNRVALLK